MYNVCVTSLSRFWLIFCSSPLTLKKLESVFLEVSKLTKLKFPPLQESRQTIKLTFTASWCSPLTFLRCIITGMASGSIVLFYNDFNRWHHEYQTRYWGWNQQRLDWQELRGGRGKSKLLQVWTLIKSTILSISWYPECNERRKKTQHVLLLQKNQTIFKKGIAIFCRSDRKFSYQS